jgi:hypothetical protein
VTVEEQSQETLLINNDTVPALFARCKLVSKDKARSSYVLMAGYQNQIFKIRYTYQPLSSESADATWKCILSSLGDSACTAKRAMK